MVRNSDAKKQHYVPQFLLRHFALGKKGRLYVFDKKLSKVYLSHVRDTAHENHFYKDDNLGYGSGTETKLANLEGTCAPIVGQIISDQSIAGLSEAEVSLICLFTSVQMTRTNKIREFLSEINQKITKWAVEKGVDPKNDIGNFELQTESEVRSSSINILNTLPGELGEDLLGKKMGLLKAPKGENFYTSDNPITMYNHLSRLNKGNLGLRVKGIEIYFPISPKLSLTFMCSETLSELRNKVMEQNYRTSMGTAHPVDMSEAESLIQGVDDKTTKVLKPENVEFQNSLQVTQSSRFIYAKSNGFELAKDMLRSNPELAESEWISA